MSDSDAVKWNKIYSTGDHGQNEVAKVLLDFAYLLPEKGKALDLACGPGANAIFLSRQGLQSCAWDISEQAIKKLSIAAKQANVNVHTEVRDVINYPPEKETFDVIFVGHFLERKIIPDLINALRHQGLLFYQTFIEDKVDGSGPKNKNYLLSPNELLELCRKLHVIVYREEGSIGRTGAGFRNKAMLIGQRRI